MADAVTVGLLFRLKSGRQAHFLGQVAEALMENAGELLEEPTIEQVDIIAVKLPGRCGSEDFLVPGTP